MRYFKLILVVIFASALQWGWAQGLSDETPVVSQEFNPLKSVHIYPNPATEFLHVKIDEFAIENVKLTLHSIIGNEMTIDSEIIDDNEQQGKLIRVRVKDLASGYYLLAVKDDQSKFRGTYKFLKR